MAFDRPGAPYPVDSTSHDSWFQHLALVTPDIATAHAHLSSIPGWQPITRGGAPVTLPAAAGGVSAFKFRDPEGHPLELLCFPPDAAPPFWRNRATGADAGPCIGIDHSAIAVSDAARSIGFYGNLGLTVGGRSLNRGPEQQALDDADAVVADVVALQPPRAPPHLELLAYRTPAVRPGSVAAADIACTRTIVAAADARVPRTPMVDPDGHRIVFAAD